jgi:hypothetical protein
VTALCNNIAACCGTSGDAATFDWQKCFNGVIVAGFHGNTTGAGFADAGNIMFNATSAQACLNDLASVDCVANQVTSAEETQIFRDCFAAYSGTLQAGAACQGTIECAPGNFCLPSTGATGDGGAPGQCQPLAEAGAPCGVLGSNRGLAETVCSYRGSGDNGLACRTFDPDASTGAALAPTAWTCQPQGAIGNTCWNFQDCTSSICHITPTNAVQCAPAAPWFNMSFCGQYQIVDAGGGG